MSRYININSKILPAKKALISVQDRGFRFGDGVFETCLIKDGVIYNWQAHKARLIDGLRAIKITLDCHPNDWLVAMDKMTAELIRKNKIKNGYLRIAVSRGVGSIGYLPIKNITPTLVIETLTLNPKPQSPIKLCISKIQKPSIKSLPTNYKLAQGLNSTLAKIEAVENNCFDAIILNQKSQICETSSANIFWIKNNILYTPHQDCGCLLGTIRAKILELSPIKIKLVKAKIDHLLNADEAFITNTSLGVLAINKIGDWEFKNKKHSKIFTNLLNEDIKKYVKNTTN